MTSKFESFPQSALDANVESRLAERGGKGKPPPPRNDIRMWNYPAELAAFYRRKGYTVETDPRWRVNEGETVHWYKLFVWIVGFEDPPWLDEMLNTDWQGRVMLLVDGWNKGAREYFNRRWFPITGMKIGDDKWNSGGDCYRNRSEVHPLTEGQDVVVYNDPYELQGGAVLSFLWLGERQFFAWLAASKRSRISWVASTHDRLFNNDFSCPKMDSNEPLADNLYTVPV